MNYSSPVKAWCSSDFFNASSAASFRSERRASRWVSFMPGGPPAARHSFHTAPHRRGGCGRAATDGSDSRKARGQSGRAAADHPARYQSASAVCDSAHCRRASGLCLIRGDTSPWHVNHTAPPSPSLDNGPARFGGVPPSSLSDRGSCFLLFQF